MFRLLRSTMMTARRRQVLLHKSHVVLSSCSRVIPQQQSLQIHGMEQHHQQQQQQQRNMCGLVAAIQDVWTTKNAGRNNYNNNNNTSINHIPILADPAVMERTASILNHRGPDGMHTSRGVIGYNGNNGNNNNNNNSSATTTTTTTAHWSMGHTRLAIVDPSNRFADMPFNLTFRENNNENGRRRLDKTIHLAANGEIYNHQALYNKAVHDGWTQNRISGSDCEVIAHCFAKYGGPETARMLDGMFAFVVFEHDAVTGQLTAFAARDPVGIKPLYYGRTTNAAANANSDDDDDAASYVFASELKALMGHVDPTTVVAIPPGHYWTPTGGLVCYYNPEWLRNDDYAPWEQRPTGGEGERTVDDLDDRIRAAFTKAVQKRMMSDVDYGFFLSGGVDSCIVAHDLLPLYRTERAAAFGDDRPIPTFTVGMENSPDVMAAKGMVEALGGARYVDHQIRYFTPDDVFDLIPKIIYHMETYEAELIRSAIPNWLLAERASQDVRMVLTGEGADELFAGYLYFQDAETPRQLQNELRRIYGMLGDANLHRTDRMTMAHGLEARVPFLDTEFTRLVMSIDPAKKMVDPAAVRSNSRGREKTLLRELFEGPNANGHSIPRPVLWRAKAMQCEGVGQDWVSILQRRVASLVSDAELKEAGKTYPVNTPHTKEELYYRRIYDEHFHGMENVVKLWEGGGRAMGAEWKSDMYTREGLKDVNLLSHSLQQARAFSTFSMGRTSHFGGKPSALSPRPSKRSFATVPNVDGQYASAASICVLAAEEARSDAKACGYNDFESWLTTGGDDRSLINTATGTNKYHIRPQPIDPTHIFRGSCTGNPPTARGYQAAQKLFNDHLNGLEGEELDLMLRDVFAEQRTRIANLLELPDGTDVILCPSGSDAEYIPLLIARTLHPKARITNGVTQLKEVGAGTAPAAVGKYFSSHAPLIGKISNVESLEGFEGISGVTISAREKNGDVVNASAEMNEFVETALRTGHFPIVHGVFGGKTGLRDATMPPSLNAGKSSLGVVDACQGRFSLDELHEWLDQDSLVLFTASKFYQAPPFCGAVLVPPKIAEKLRQSSAPTPHDVFSEDGIGGFLTDKELPRSLKSWKPRLRKLNTNNIGLALRMEAGLAGMEALAVVPDSVRTAAVKKWASSVADAVRVCRDLDPWCIERSIVSIRVAKPPGQDGTSWLNMTELRHLYRWMSLDVSHAVPDASPQEKKALSVPAYIGQPVDVSESHAIVRIALGVDSLLSYLEDEDGTLAQDRLTVQKLAAIAKHFETLKKSGL